MAEQFPDPRDTYGRLVRCETKVDGVIETIGDLKRSVEQIDTKLDGVVEYVNTRRGAFRVAERIGLFFITITAAVLGTLLSWWHQK
jgi:hypothetical protein